MSFMRNPERAVKSAKRLFLRCRFGEFFSLRKNKIVCTEEYRGSNATADPTDGIVTRRNVWSVHVFERPRTKDMPLVRGASLKGRGV